MKSCLLTKYVTALLRFGWTVSCWFPYSVIVWRFRNKFWSLKTLLFYQIFTIILRGNSVRPTDILTFHLYHTIAYVFSNYIKSILFCHFYPFYFIPLIIIHRLKIWFLFLNITFKWDLSEYFFFYFSLSFLNHFKYFLIDRVKFTAKLSDWRLGIIFFITTFKQILIGVFNKKSSLQLKTENIPLKIFETKILLLVH